MEEIEKEIFENNNEKLQKLQDYVAAGCLLHGSKTRFEVAEPRQASDTNPERTTGKAFAIYATHDWRIPIFMATMDRKNPDIGLTSGYSAKKESIIFHGDSNLDFSKGFIYVFPPDTFESENNGDGNEMISRVPVTPIDVIEIDPTMLRLIPNAEYQISNESEL